MVMLSKVSMVMKQCFYGYEFNISMVMKGFFHGYLKQFLYQAWCMTAEPQRDLQCIRFAGFNESIDKAARVIKDGRSHLSNRE